MRGFCLVWPPSSTPHQGELSCGEVIRNAKNWSCGKCFTQHSTKSAVHVRGQRSKCSQSATLQTPKISQQGRKQAGREPPAWFERNKWSLLSCCRSSDDVFSMLERVLIHILARVFAAGAATLASTSAFAAEWREKWIKGTDRWLNKWDQINQPTFLLPLSEFIPPSPLSLSLHSFVTFLRSGERGTIYSARLLL